MFISLNIGCRSSIKLLIDLFNDKDNEDDNPDDCCHHSGNRGIKPFRNIIAGNRCGDYEADTVNKHLRNRFAD